MAQLMVCSVFDSKVGAYGTLMLYRTKGEAIRAMTEACKDANLPFGKYPSDYRLFCVGMFDDNSGALERFVNPEPIIGADEVGL